MITIETLISFTIMITAIIGVVINALNNKNNRPVPKLCGYFLTNHFGTTVYLSVTPFLYLNYITFP